jgi:TonB family protein
MKTLREYIDQLDEISRRDFLRGTGAAALAGLAGKAKADDVEQNSVEDITKKYYYETEKAIRSKNRYPSSREARLTKPQGIVALIITLNNGSLLDVKILKSSDSNILDLAALRAIKDTQFPEPPEELKDKNLNFKYNFSYSSPQPSPKEIN